MRSIAHLSDLHLDGDEARAENHQDRLLGSLVHSLARVHRERPFSLLVVTGDVFDSASAPASAIRRFVDLLGEIRAALGVALPCVVQPGNHDRRVAGVVGPNRAELFEALAAHQVAGVRVAGRGTPFLVEHLPRDFHGLPAHLVVYDSTYLPRGLLSAGGWIRSVDLLEVAERVRREEERGEAGLPLVLLTHHHIVPTPLTDVGRIDFDRLPWIFRGPAQKALSGLIANGDREELTMTALGAGSALTLLHAMGRAIVVLHGHKHYPTARLVQGLLPDQGDVLLASAGSGGLVERWQPEGGAGELGIWPSFNVVTVDEARWTVDVVAFSDDKPEEPSRRRTLADVARRGASFAPRDFKLNADAKPLRYELDERRCTLSANDAHPDELWDVESARTLIALPPEPPPYRELLRGAPGAVAVPLDGEGAAGEPIALPAKVTLARDGATRFVLRGAACQRRSVAARHFGKDVAHEWVGLLVRYGARRARLVLRGLPDGAALAFGGRTDLTTGFEEPVALARAGDELVLEVADCPPRTRLRILWPLRDE